MPKTYSLDRALGTSTATRLHFVEDRRVPDPTIGVQSFDSLRQMRDTFSPEQLAGLLQIDSHKVTTMTTDIPKPTDPTLWRVSDGVWTEVQALMDKLDPPRPGAAKRADQRAVLNGVTNKALSGTSYQRLGDHFANPITTAQTADKWYRKGVLRPLIALLDERCPELDRCDWSRSLTKVFAEKFRSGEDINQPKPRRAAKVQPGPAAPDPQASLLTRFGVQVQPQPLGRLTVGALVVDLLFDPSPAGESAPARHTYGTDHQIIFASTADVAAVGRAISQHLAKAEQQVGEGRRRA